jgi:hypothetical protein
MAMKKKSLVGDPAAAKSTTVSARPASSRPTASRPVAERKTAQRPARGGDGIRRA